MKQERVKGFEHREGRWVKVVEVKNPGEMRRWSG